MIVGISVAQMPSINSKWERRYLQLNIEVRKVREHYEIYVNGDFYCSCDNRREVDEELSNIETL